MLLTKYISFYYAPIFVTFICILYMTRDIWRKSEATKINCKVFGFQAKESPLAHLLLDNLKGIEIGGSLHNPFCLNTINIDFTNESNGYKYEERRLSGGKYLTIDVNASGDKLPFKNETYDFVISSHAIEHFYDPIKTINEWFRVIKKNGYIFMIIPHKERTFDKYKNRTTLNELLERHKNPKPMKVDLSGHFNVWITEDFIKLCQSQNWKIAAILDKDDKVGNGFTFVLQKS